MGKGTYANTIYHSSLFSSDPGIETREINETRSGEPEQACGRGADETKSR